MIKRKRDYGKKRLVMVVCLLFLVGVIGGAIAANLLEGGTKTDLSGFIQETAQNRQNQSFAVVFWKYLKYDFVIWLGGWMSMGLFLSGATFLLRSISVGFASAMMMITYGAKGVIGAVTAFLPQNLLLIPTYIFIMCAALYYLSAWQERGGKKGLKRERRRKQTEYCLVFLASVILIALGAGVEVALYPL